MFRWGGIDELHIYPLNSKYCFNRSVSKLKKKLFQMAKLDSMYLIWDSDSYFGTSIK